MDLSQLDALFNSGIISTLIVLGSFILLAVQIKEMRRATVGQSFIGIVEIVQDQEMRETRGRVFGLRGKSVDAWTEADVRDVERVCQSYDIFGQLCRNKLIPTPLVVDSWGDSIMRSWEICAPYVKRLRRDRDAPEFWDDFEWLYQRAKKFNWRRRFRRRMA